MNDSERIDKLETTVQLLVDRVVDLLRAVPEARKATEQRESMSDEEKQKQLDKLRAAMKERGFGNPRRLK